MIDWLAQQCGEHLLAEKWLLAPQLSIAVQWKDRVNRRGCHTINLHAKTLPTVALSLVSNKLAAAQRQFVAQPTVRMIVRSVLANLLDQEQLEYFRAVQSIDGLSQLVARSIRDLRLAGVRPSEIYATAFQSPAKAADFQKIYQGYCDLLSGRGVVDDAGCVETAIEGVEDRSIALPEDLLILMPESLRLSRSEQRLLDLLATKSTLRCPPHIDRIFEWDWVKDRSQSDGAPLEFFAALGEVNEIRGVFQKILARSPAERRLDDVEILHTDYQQYVPLVLEQSMGWIADQSGQQGLVELDALPVTFAEGIACVYSRPGRALRGWLRWVRHDGVQTRAVQLIREGLLVRGEEWDMIGYSRLANSLRRVPIGFRIDRYRPKIGEAIRAAEGSLREYQQTVEAEADDDDKRRKRDFGLPVLRAVLEMIEPLVDCAPTDGEDARGVLGKAKRFLLFSARAESKLDRLARARLLDEIDGMLATLELTPVADLDVIHWLEELPIESRVLASGPRPGCLHVASLQHGGYSGRKQIFVVGLDDARYPARIAVDSVLLDTERTKLSKALSTAEDAGDEANRALDRALARVFMVPDCRVCLSYSNRSLVDDRANFPSASLLEMYRIASQHEDADIDDFQGHLGPAVSFVSEAATEQLSKTELQLGALLTEADAQKREQCLEHSFAHVRFQRIAQQAAISPHLTAYDGFVPDAGADLDPADADRVSASRMEAIGVCPRRFLFRYGLGIDPPDEYAIDREKWLDPLHVGNLVHGLFEQFLAELTERDLTPSFQRDRDRLMQLLDEKIAVLKNDIPVPNEDAYQRTHELLLETCDIFLASEEAYCREHDARPWVLEASIGLSDEPKTELDCREPISLALSDGRLIRVGGRLDRVDQCNSTGSERYAIWDYKSGSSYGFDQENPLNQGRKLQPFLYVSMLRHRLAAIGRDTDAVLSFGYFFPNPRTEGLRMQWTRGQLRGGDKVLQQICDLITGGAFVATTEPRDCTYCDYLPVCGDAEFVSSQSLMKSNQPCNEMLEPWRQLRDLPVEVQP